MSEQNNYIDFLRESTILKEQNTLKPVLNSSDYIKFKNYNLVNSIPNTKNSFSEMFLNNKKNVFGMERNTNNCSNFILCRNTNGRANRALNSAQLPVPTFRLNKSSTKTKIIEKQIVNPKKIIITERYCECKNN